MPREELPADQEALEQWEKLPHKAPTSTSLPPATGGTKWAWGFIGLMFLIVLLVLILQNI